MELLTIMRLTTAAGFDSMVISYHRLIKILQRKVSPISRLSKVAKEAMIPIMVAMTTEYYSVVNQTTAD
jgi:hypothetical protein